MIRNPILFAGRGKVAGLKMAGKYAGKVRKIPVLRTHLSGAWGLTSALLLVPVEQVVMLELVDLAVQDGFHIAAFAVGAVILDQAVRLEGAFAAQGCTGAP